MGLLLNFLLIVLSTIVVSSRPANVTMNSYEGLYGKITIGQEPRGRGTFGIVLSSTVTFFFCIWTAVHPNLVAGASFYSRMIYRSFLMILAIGVPEGIAVCAFGQWREARVLLKAWRLKMEIPEPTWTETFKFWLIEDDGLGLDGAFFVVMGGFLVDLVNPITGRVVTPVGQTTTLTSNGFLKYLDEGYIHKLTFDRVQIAEKGSSSVLAKSIAGAQALWFMVQCFSRWSVGLPLTLLEIHVGIQVLCTVALYMFWWSKPLDVNTPIKIVLQMKGDYKQLNDTMLPIHPIISQSDLECEFTKRDAQLLDANSMTQSFITQPAQGGVKAMVCKASHDVVIYVTERPIGASKANKKSSLKSVVFEGVLVVGSGILHAAAWNVAFPTLVECWLWRVSSVALIVFPLGIVWVTMANRYHQDLAMMLWKMQMTMHTLRSWLSMWFVELFTCCKRHTITSRGRRSPILFVVHAVQLAIAISMLGCYAAAIAFVTFESYISLRSPPEGAFLTPVWVNYWPHV